ncbi:phosphoglycerate kinase [Streptomyces subrutilus]|nr:phosphoglycerate kinase [Streptomyces subrutilus]
MTALDLSGKRVLVRADLNVPVKNGKVSGDAKLRAALPTLELALKQGAKVLVASHFGRPVEGKYSDEYSLQPVADRLKELLSYPVRLAKDYLSGIAVAAGEVVVLENVGFNQGEKANSEALARQYGALCDVFVMDAFSVTNRELASACGSVRFAPTACAGPLLLAELTALNSIVSQPHRPVVAVVGAAKLSDKLALLENLLKVADTVLVGGGIANTILAAQGFEVGKSLHEMDMVSEAKRLMFEHKGKLVRPGDVYVGAKFSETATATLKSVSAVQSDEMILDVGQATAHTYARVLKDAATILWHGPVGVFEFPNFRQGTQAVGQAIADNSRAFSVAGGAETLAAIDLLGIADKISHISEGRGATLKYLEGTALPGLRSLVKRDA